jgi:hypothetical protein
MSETTTPDIESVTAGAPREHFAKAVDSAKAAAQAFGKQAQEYAGAYQAKVGDTAADWSKQAKVRGDEALDRAHALANDGKAKASGAIHGFGKLVEDNATVVDEHVGAAYGDYVRTAGRSMQDFAGHLDSKEFSELAEDAREFIRNRPGVALGIAAAGGFLLARMFKGSED